VGLEWRLSSRGEGRAERLSTPLEKTAAKGKFVRFEKIINLETQTAAISGYRLR
jgi:hypothetical protein